MKIYVNREGQRHGPYRPEDIRSWLHSGRLAPTDLAWIEGTADWQPLNSLLPVINDLRPGNPCPRCGGELALQTEKPNSGTGCIVLLLGLLLAPVIIGIFIMIYGYAMMNETKHHWHCRNCGTVFPA